MADLKLPTQRNSRLSRQLRRIPVYGVLFGCLSAMGYAQQTARLSSSESNPFSLPDAPSATLLQQEPSPEQQFTGNISGTVLDLHEYLVSNATITLLEEGNPTQRTTLSDIEGDFIFPALGPGKYKLTITSPGLDTFISPEINLHLGEHYELPRIALPLAAANVSVQVTVTEAEIAQEQIHLEEKQRLIGVLPNFYSSYIWDAAPLSPKQKFVLAAHSIFDPISFLVTGIAAGVEQANNTFPAYGQGAQGYAKRFGADYADDVINRMISSAALPVLFHQDPRYFYKGSGSVTSRVLYAVSRSVITRGDDGRSKPNYSQVLGAFAAGGLANTYRVGTDRGVGLTLGNGFLSIGGHAADNLLREFLFKHLTPKVPDYEKGKPVSASASPSH